MKYTFQTDSAAEGLRIDACIRRFLPELPSRAAQEAFSHRDVKLDGKRVKPDVRVHAGQCVEVFCMEQAAPLLDVVYEDADVLLVNKRAGISVEADERGGVTLTELAARHVRQQAPDARAPKACHRLDNQTCGLLMFAKTEKAEGILERAFRDRTMDQALHLPCARNDEAAESHLPRLPAQGRESRACHHPRQRRPRRAPDCDGV